MLDRPSVPSSCSAASGRARPRGRQPSRLAIAPVSFQTAVAVLGLAVLVAALPLPAQEALQRPPEATSAALPTVTPADYGKFESLGAVSLSRDGRWLSAVLSRADEDGELRFGPARGGELRTVANGTRAEFSADGAWIAVAVQPSQAERQRLERDRQPVRSDLKLFATGSDAEQHVARVQTFAFSPDGRYLLMRRYRSAEGGGASAPRGTDVVVRELATGVDVNFGNLSESQWAPEGAVLAMVTDAEGQAGNGVRLYEAATGHIRNLHVEAARFAGLTWRDDSRDLAVFRVDPDSVRGDTIHTVLAWRDATREGSAPRILEGTLTGADGGELRTSNLRNLQWADDGGRLFLAVQERPEPRREPEGRGRGAGGGDPAEGGGARGGGPGGAAPAGGRAGGASDSVPGLEIWHARDVDPVPQQRLRANQDRRRSALAAWDLSGPPVVLGGDRFGESVSLISGQKRALLTDDEPYAPERMFGPVFRDLHVVDVATGVRTPVAARVEYTQGSSPGGRYLLFFRDEHHWVHDIERGETRNISASVPATFANQEVDRPVTDVTQRPSYGVGGWTEGDRHVLLYDRYDVWRVRPDGQGGERLTKGAEDEVRHRLVRLEDNDDGSYPVNGPLWVSLYGEWTKQSGYGRLVPGRDVQRLVWEDSSVGRLTLSEDGGTLAFVSQRVDRSPSLTVADRDLRSPSVLVTTNDFAADFAWGGSRLIDYRNAWGERLQGALHYPANYEPGRTYPMIVYPYERRSQQLHSWSNPSERSAYNTTVFTQNGYFVLQPDIVYRPRNPGVSFMEAVVPALDAAVATGMIDPDRIGLTGHSWGGYQTTFAVTQTDRFAAAVAGAPLTNLISMYLSFYWNSGGTDARIFEISQGRMEVPWWEDPESYYANSPVHHIQKMSTPLLMAFGTEDGAVEFNQGVEFYNAARRLDKDFVLLVYDGENHSLARRPNQIDYHRRSLEWFNHHLKGEPAPPWITEGVRYLDQQEKLRQGPAAGRQPVPAPVAVTSSASSGGPGG